MLLNENNDGKYYKDSKFQISRSLAEFGLVTNNKNKSNSLALYSILYSIILKIYVYYWWLIISNNNRDHFCVCIIHVKNYIFINRFVMNKII